MSTDQPLQFRLLQSAEEAAGYAILTDTVAWLRSRDIELWRDVLPRPIYARRQQLRQNFGLFYDGELAVTLSIGGSVPGYWATDVPSCRAPWLCTLATATRWRGKGLGAVAVVQAMAFLCGAAQPAVWLDCAPGYLEGFYERLGFRRVVRRVNDIPHTPCGRFDTVLMACALPAGGPVAREQ